MIHFIGIVLAINRPMDLILTLKVIPLHRLVGFQKLLYNQSGISTAEITALTDAQNINGSTSFAVGETNNGGISDTLPVYLPLPINGTPVEFCSFNNFGTFNKLGNRRFLEFEIPTAGAYRIQMSREVCHSWAVSHLITMSRRKPLRYLRVSSLWMHMLLKMLIL